jgi:3-O-methylgallate 3,4-dioxygenase
MAKIVTGLASSHGPQINIEPSRWKLLADKDEADPRIDYKALLRAAPAGLGESLTPLQWQQQYEACHRALKVLSHKLTEAAPDVLVLIGDDQNEQFRHENMPMFSIYYGPTVSMFRRERPKAAEWQRADEEGVPSETREFPAHPALARHLIESFRQQGVDVSASNQLREEEPLGHAFTFLYRWLLPECRIPIVPLAINTFFPPNQPTPARSYQVGEALRKGIESWDSDKRVAVIASGGLSHTVIDEEIDRALLDALQRKDASALCALPEDRMTKGTSELRNWIALGATLQDLEMCLVDYVTCYRTPAGTGCAMGFAYWE